MLFSCALGRQYKIQGESPLDPLFEPPANPPFDLSKIIFIVISSFRRLLYQKILVSVKMFARNSGAGNGCPIYGCLEKLRSLCRKTCHVHKIPRFRGGGGILGWGGKCRFYFYGRGDFSDYKNANLPNRACFTRLRGVGLFLFLTGLLSTAAC